MSNINELVVILKECWNLVVDLFNTTIPEDVLGWIDSLMYSTLWYLRDIVDQIGPIA